MMPRSLRYPGLGETTDPTSRETFLVQQMHAFAVAIGQAKQRGDVKGVENMLPTFKKLADEYRALGENDLTDFDRFILSTGDWIAASRTAAANLVKDTADLVGNVGGNLIKPVVPSLWPIAIGLVAVAFILGGGKIPKLRK